MPIPKPRLLYIYFFSQNYFCIDFEVFLGSLSCWKVHLRPTLSFLAEIKQLVLGANVLVLGAILNAIDLNKSP